MSKRKFTEEQVQKFRENPYTFQVSHSRISFTREFKELYWKEYRGGTAAEQILSKYGYDPEVLGSNRVYGLTQLVRREFEQYQNFYSGPRPADPKTKKTVSPSNDAGAIRALQHEVEYLKQEIEFLKKITAIRTTGK